MQTIYTTEQPQVKKNITVAYSYEIDSTDDVFGKLYRLWGSRNRINLLGTFYQNLDGVWISQPCNTKARSYWTTDTQAINAILAA